LYAEALPSASLPVIPAKLLILTGHSVECRCRN